VIVILITIRPRYLQVENFMLILIFTNFKILMPNTLLLIVEVLL